MRHFVGDTVGLFKFLYSQRLRAPVPPGDVGLDPDAKDEFLKRLREASGYLEFGSGGSTLAAAKSGVKTLSVEGDPVYARLVRQCVEHAGNIEVIHVDIGLTREWSRPAITWRTKGRLERWRKYYEAPFGRLEELGWFPDFIFIDGRFRRACILETARRATAANCQATIMVDDYFLPGREHYHRVERWLGRPQPRGRAAIFELERAALRSVPSRGDVEEAAQDYR